MNIGELKTKDGVSISDVSSPPFLCLKDGVFRSRRIVIAWLDGKLCADVFKDNDDKCRQSSSFQDTHSTFKSASERYQKFVESKETKENGKST